jgi:N-acetylmuramoyl-L-alanine amidase
MLRSTVALFGGMSLVTTLVLGLPHPSGAQGSTAAPTRSLLQVGATGNDVTELQGVLRLMGLYEGPIDGVFSDATFTAVTRFQQLAGLGPDGIVGAATWGKLLPPAPGETPIAVIVPAPIVPPTAAPTSPPSETAPIEPILRKGAEGPAVSRLQRRLQARGFYSGMIDGGFGDETEAAVQAAQRQAGLEVDGIVGPATWDAIR